MKAKFRKSIRIGGRQVTQGFTNREAANAWYNQLHSKKIMDNFGLSMPAQREGVLFKEFAEGEFMTHRRANYPASTYKSDEQRLRDYLMPAFGNMQLARIPSVHIRAVLDNLVVSKRLSARTRDRVRALMSAIYSLALNRKEPLVSHNPTFGLTFDQGRRTGKKKPSFLHTNHDGVAYLQAARNLSWRHFGVGVLGLMAGLRKQEMIALRHRHIDPRSHQIEISEKYIQAANKIVAGTKSGDFETRYVPMSDELYKVLMLIKRGSTISAPNDFVLHDPDGKHLSPRRLSEMHEQTCEKAGVVVTVHGLRHTFGREFMESTGNVKALQAILGHSSSAVTDIYSDLSGERLKGFRGVVKFDLDGQNGTKKDNK